MKYLFWEEQILCRNCYSSILEIASREQSWWMDIGRCCGDMVILIVYSGDPSCVEF